MQLHTFTYYKKKFLSFSRGILQQFFFTACRLYRTLNGCFWIWVHSHDWRLSICKFENPILFFLQSEQKIDRLHAQGNSKSYATKPVWRWPETTRITSKSDSTFCQFCCEHKWMTSKRLNLCTLIYRISTNKAIFIIYFGLWAQSCRPTDAYIWMFCLWYKLIKTSQFLN